MHRKGDIVRLNIEYINSCDYCNDFKRWSRKNKNINFYIDEVFSNDKDYSIRRLKYDSLNCKIIIVNEKDIVRVI